MENERVISHPNIKHYHEGINIKPWKQIFYIIVVVDVDVFSHTHPIVV